MELTAIDKTKKGERERERESMDNKDGWMIAMGWAVKHETSKHIDTPHV